MIKPHLLIGLCSIILMRNLNAQQVKIDSLETILTREISDSLRARVLYNLTFKYLSVNPQKGKQYAKEGLLISEHNKEKEWFNYMNKSLYLNLGSSYLSIGDLDSAFTSYELAIQYNNNIDSMFSFKVMSNMGTVMAKKGEHDKAMVLFDSCLTTIASINSIKEWVKQRHMGKSHVNMGSINYLLGNYVESKKHFYKALEYYEKHKKNDRLKHSVLSNLSVILTTQNEYVEAIELLQRALEDANKAENAIQMIQYAGSIGTNHRALGNLDSALIYHKQNLPLAKQLGLLEQLSLTYSQIGNDFSKFKIPDSALYYFLKKYDIDTKRNSKIELGNTHRNIGKLLTEFPDLISSNEIKKFNWNPIGLLESARKIGLESKDVNLIRSSYNALSELYFRNEQPKKAYKYLLALKSLQDSVFSNEKTKALAEADAKYETEKKEQQLALKDAELAQNELLISKQAIQRNGMILGSFLLIILAAVLYRNYKFKSKSNNEKEALLKEIHHRVKNNLQIIANLLYLQSGKFEDENIKNVLEEGQGRVRSMALIHQKLYENEDLKSIPFGEYILELVNEIKTSFGEQAAKVKIKVDAQEAFFDVDSAVPLGLIINELTTNAFKYAFEDKKEGQFNIFLTKSGNDYVLHISDNGKGIPKEIDIRKTRSLGLRLVRILSEQLEGEYEFESQDGMSFKLKFAA